MLAIREKAGFQFSCIGLTFHTQRLCPSFIYSLLWHHTCLISACLPHWKFFFMHLQFDNILNVILSIQLQKNKKNPTNLVEAAVEDFFDRCSFKGSRLKVSFVVMVKERQCLSRVCGGQRGEVVVRLGVGGVNNSIHSI